MDGLTSETSRKKEFPLDPKKRCTWESHLTPFLFPRLVNSLKSPPYWHKRTVVCPVCTYLQDMKSWIRRSTINQSITTKVKAMGPTFWPSTDIGQSLNGQPGGLQKESNTEPQQSMVGKTVRDWDLIISQQRRTILEIPPNMWPRSLNQPREFDWDGRR